MSNKPSTIKTTFYIQRFFALGVMILFAIYCTQCEKTNQATKQHTTSQIDSLHKQAFAFMRKRQWEDSFSFATKADSLAIINKNPTASAKSLRIQAYYWNHKNRLDSAFYVLQQSERIEKSTNNYKGILAVYNTKALLYKRNELYDEALESYMKALSIQDSSITKKQRSTTHANLANVYTKLGIYDKAVDHYQQALVLNKADATSRQTIRTYTNLGNVYSLSSDYKLAEFYYIKALQHYQTFENDTEIAKLYNNLGALFYEKGEDLLSLEYFKKSIQLKEQLQDSSALVEGYLNIAELYSEKNRNMPIAFKYLDKASQLVTGEKKASNLAKIHLSKASMYQAKYQIAKAKKELEKAILLSKNQGKLTFERYLVKIQSEIAFAEGNLKEAYQYRIAYEKLNDSVFNEQKLWEIAAIQKSNQAQAKKAEITLLEKDRMLAEEVASRKQEENKKLYGYLIAIAISMCLLGIIAVYFYKLKKTASQLAKQQELFLNERIQNLVNDQEIDIINATLSAREKEKEEISKELHNNIGSLLTSVKFHFQAFDQNVLFAHEGTKKIYEKTIQIIDNATDEVRAISHRFDKDPIPEFNLENAIITFSQKVENKNLKVHTTIHGLEEFQNSQTSITIFRILQELVNNVLKHAEASELSINITRNSDGINIIVEDNGKGFNVGKKQHGIGLKNLKKQLINMDGSCHIDSNEARGTIVNVDIPIH
ncbi:tetratricopeptide repeat protein [Kordia sp. YSTF-M3]|uniref:histidine kinase n=1 Tax=Kordia aestuariivivens TaxID=2759037 RepID=A0ABR7QFQ9_9FLAO|nr:tetratricopeptide repeat protein [Kordia aestuariivivens]MBC8757391.1 tetratricopeptide repeat protein [Kordia aestuariivivens]